MAGWVGVACRTSNSFGDTTSGSIRDGDSQVPGGGGTVEMVTSGVAGAIVVGVDTVDKLTTVGAPYGSLGGSPTTQGIRVGRGLAFAPDTLGLGRAGNTPNRCQDGGGRP